MSGPGKKFQFDKNWPAHLSVGCVLLNDKNEVALHYMAKTPLGDNLYWLMRETIHDNETLEHAVARGLQEEMGATASLLAFLDSTRAVFNENLSNGRRMHKTTLYFLARLTSFDLAKRDAADEEIGTTIVWLPLPKAKELLQKQVQRLPNRPDLHEAAVIDWAQKYLHV